MMEDQFNNEEEIEVLPPMKLKEYLDEHIISQEEAKRVVSTAVYKHFMRILQPDFGDGVDINKGNICILGASGCGKCITEDTYVNIRNRKTNKIEKISVKNFIKLIN